MQARRRAQPSGTNSPSSSHPRLKHRARCAIFCPCPPCGRQGRPGQGFLAGSNIRAAGERPPRARPQRRGSPGPIPNPAVKPAFAESTAAKGCGRAGRRARGGRFSICARRTRRERPAGDVAPCGLFAFRAAGPPIRHLRMMRLSVWPSSRRRCGVRVEGLRRDLRSDSFLRRGWQIDLTVPAALRRHRACRGTPLQAFSACGCRKLL